MYRSSDYGISWTNVNDTNAIEIPDLANSPLSPDYVYCTFFQGKGGLKRSVNKGMNWININIDDGAWAIDIAKDDPNVLAYGNFDNTGSINFSTDGGIHFTSSYLPTGGGTFALFYYDRD